MSAAKWFLVVAIVLVLSGLALVFRSGPSPESTEAEVQDPPADRPSENPPTRSDADPNPVVATVGPLEIRLKDLTDLSESSETAVENLEESTATTLSKRRVRERFLDDMIERRLLVLGSARHPEWVTDASWEVEVQRRLVEIGPDELERRRTLAGIPKEEFFADFRKHVREEMMKDAILAREVDSHLEVTEEELKNRYETDRESVYYRPPAWGIYRFERFIPRDPDVDTAPLQEEVERIREQVAGRIDAATNPRGMAQRMAETLEESFDPETDRAGHAYVYDMPKAEFDPALKSHLRNCVIGDLSPVFELAGDAERRGFCFYLPYSHQPAEEAPFDRVRQVLRGQIREEKKKEQTSALFERLKKEFPVEIHSERLDLDPPMEAPKETAL